MNSVDWNPTVVVGLATPFLVLLGVLIKTGLDWVIAKWNNKSKSKEIVVSEKLANVSEQEAQTHQIQAIFEGFNAAIAAASKRAEAAEAAVAKVSERVTKLEEEREEYLEERDLLVRHIVDLEALVPSPPGPPARPKW